MKFKTFKWQAVCILVLCPGIFALQSFALDSGTIKVQITGLRNDKGCVRIALFDDARAFGADKFDASGAVAKNLIAINGGVADGTFAHLPYGKYAIRLFHDEDKSGKFYANFLGIPKVQYGFSNNAHGHFGPASFEQAMFKLEKSEIQLDIIMQ